MQNAGSDVVVEVLNADGAGQVLLLCEHASRYIPPEFANLGLNEDQLTSHAVWDPGARDLALLLSAALDAPLVASKVSRLVYDCNRPPEVASAIPAQSELIVIPGNQNLDQTARAQRAELAYEPFCQAVDQLIRRREQAGVTTIVVTVHSFTPVYFGKPREVEIGLLHDSDSRLVDAMMQRSSGVPHRCILRNSPYGPEDGVTHSLKIHAIERGLANVMVEVRNDLLSTSEAIEQVCKELLTLLKPALQNPLESAARA